MGPFETSETLETRNFLLFSEPFNSKPYAIYVIWNFRYPDSNLYKYSYLSNNESVEFLFTLWDSFGLVRFRDNLIFWKQNLSFRDVGILVVSKTDGLENWRMFRVSWIYELGFDPSLPFTLQPSSLFTFSLSLSLFSQTGYWIIIWFGKPWDL